MKLAELARDSTLVPTPLNPRERAMRAGFIVIRIRNLQSATPDPTDIPDGIVFVLRTKLAGEITQALAAYSTIRSRVSADVSAGKFLSLANVDRRMRQNYQAIDLIPGTLAEMREQLVQSIVWWAVGTDATLLDPARIDDLNLLVDRRLRVTERMLYDVGRVNHEWHVNEISNNPAGPWKDNWNRIFEYPRVPQQVNSRVFKGICNPDTTSAQVCQNAAMTDWQVRGVVHLVLRNITHLNPIVQFLWERPPAGALTHPDYCFYLKAGSDPVKAIEDLFTPSKDYKDRNLLFCDHVIHMLHIEALLWAKKKRSADTSWLASYIGGNPSLGRLRIHIPIWNGPAFLAGQNDGTYLEFQRIHVSGIQVGDHLIVYNHPAYDKATVGGVWRLENAIAVIVYPRLLFQGHGTNPLTLDQMKQTMIGLFNQELNRLRRRVEDHLSSGSSATEIDFGGGGMLVRKVAPAVSEYITANQKADWWLRWNLDDEKDEKAIAASPTRRALALAQHKVEYDSIHGYFPLWEPVLRTNGTPIRNSTGKITRIQPVVVTANMVAAWTWYLPENSADRDTLPVLRPRL
jgi:hypothetical protein